MHVRGLRVPAKPNRGLMTPSSRSRQSETYRYQPACTSLTMRSSPSSYHRATPWKSPASVPASRIVAGGSPHSRQPGPTGSPPMATNGVSWFCQSR